jgi:hypothetical protein
MARTTLVAASILGILCLSACGGGDSQQHPADQPSVESSSADVCVAMAGSNGMVGGLQMELSWDSACMTAALATGNAAQCTSNPSTGKSVETGLLSDAEMRVLFLSLSDTSPVPDGDLFCCKFAVAQSQAGSCCSVELGNLILAGLTGHRIYGPNMTVQVSVGGVACSATAPSTPIPPIGSPPAMQTPTPTSSLTPLLGI